MYALIDNAAPSSGSSTARPTRATLQTRPRIQRSLIRSWEYVRPVRISILIVRMLVVLWLLFLSGVLLWTDNVWGATLLPAAGAVFAVSFWVFDTASKGWPVADA